MVLTTIMNYNHVPVLLKEVVELLDPKPGEDFADGTLGGGGYTRALLEKTKPKGRILAIDLDKDAIRNIESGSLNQELGKRLFVHHRNFKDIDKIAQKESFEGFDGIVVDLGMSSYQLDQAERGISFQKKELLDMRFDQSQKEDAKFILNTFEEKRLVEIFENYGEEKFSRQIARKIIEYRIKNQELKYTTELMEVIEEALPKPVKHKAKDSARRVFQALRIAVNHELSNLEEFLPKSFSLLKPGGRLAVVSFHSLEDRIVKRYFLELTKGCVCPLDFPICQCGKNPQGKLLTKKPISPSETENKNNPRAKSSKLRAIIKI